MLLKSYFTNTPSKLAGSPDRAVNCARLVTKVMEYSSKRQKISRIQVGYRRAVEVGKLSDDIQIGDFEAKSPEEDSQPPSQEPREPLLIREMKGRKVMGKKHRLLHRRQASESSYPTTVNVVATVNRNGSAIAIQTVPFLPTVPAVSPFPSDLTVPAVPQVTSVALPSVPAYPFTSTTTTTTTAASGESVQAMGATSQIVLSSPLLTPLPIASSVAPRERNSTTITTSFPTTVNTDHFSSAIGRNSTVSSKPFSLLQSIIITNTSLGKTLSFTGLPFNRNSTIVSASRHSSSVHVTSSTSQTSSSEVSSSVTNSASSAATAGVGGFGIPGGTAAASTTPTAATGNGANHPSNNNPISTPQVVGSVIGSLAGLTVLLVLALLILRRYKRKQRALQGLSETSTVDTRPIAGAGQQMAQRSSFMPAAAASFFSRFSSSSRGTVDPGGTLGQERGFQKISGRKLPSAFSEGMTSDSVPFDRATLSGSSFYRDSQGFYGGPGVAATATAAGRSHHAGVEKEKLMPSPARTPVVHHPEEYPPLRDPVVPSGAPQSPPQPTQFEPRGTLGRSHPSHDDSRGSKFTEYV